MPRYDKKASDYINRLDDERRKFLRLLRKLIFDTVPDVKESFAYRMPTYEFNGTLVAIASQKHHVGVYIFNEALLRDFLRDMPQVECGKCCMRFKKIEDVPLHWLANLLKATAEANRLAVN